jgi:hypothetical protein
VSAAVWAARSRNAGRDLLGQHCGAARSPFHARKPTVEKSGNRVRQRRRRVRVAPIAIDEVRHRRLHVAGGKRDDKRTAVVDELRLALAAPDDDGPRALAHRPRVGQIAAHVGAL